MKFNICVITNRLSTRIQVQDDLDNFKEYVASKTPLQVEYTHKTTDLPLTHKSFGVHKKVRGNNVLMHGLDGIKEKIRGLNIIEKNKYHAVVFLYDLKDTAFEDKHDIESLGHWTYYGPLYDHTEFVEIAATEGWDKINDIFRVLTHEIYHVWHYRLKRQGISTEDTMDEYDHEFNVYAQNGNRERNLREVNNYWKNIVHIPKPLTTVDVLKNITKALNMKIINLQSKIDVLDPSKKKARIEDWAEAIKEFEGWYVGSRSYRNHNPGNLRWSKYQIGQDSGNYAIFKTYNDGWKALLFQLSIALNGKSRYYSPSMSLLDFFNVYAPSNDDNHPEVYAKYVARKLDVDVNEKLKDIFIS